ncbi:MAG: PAS domain-containing protein [Deltaproteobacteria bacterium]|nr:PAS domain-containing protein [Deltaproteobacteria bacterium]
MADKPSYEELEQRIAELQAAEAACKQAVETALDARRYAETLVETVREPLVVLDDRLRVISANRSFFTTFRVLPEETVHKLIYEVGNNQWDIPRLRELLEEIIPRNTKFEAFEVEHDFKNIGHKTMVLNARRLKGANHETEMILLAIEDVTERRQAEKKLRKSGARIQALNEEVLTMLMVVSHDIRNPLISIEATLKLLARGIYGHMDESVKNTVIDLYGRINRLFGVAEDCLGKTSAVAGDVDFERKMLDLREDIIDPVLAELSQEMEQQDIVIDNRLGAIPANQIPINANRVWLKIVFRNLFSNAIKYGGKGCTIAFGFEDHGSYYKLNVYNSGEPIPEQCRDRLFTRFFRIGGKDQRVSDGMGLGLYLTKEIIGKHGGDIWYEAKDWGSNFVLTLPHDQP